MKSLTREELAGYSANSLRELAVSLAWQLDSAERINKNLEKQVELLAGELGAKNQAVLLASEAFDRLKHLKFGDSSERREDDSPLFGGANAEEEKKDPPKPRKRRSRNGRRPQPELPVQDINHTFSEEDVKANGLTVWEGQCETSEQISVIPSRIVLERHHRQKYFQDNAETGETTIVTAPGPLKLKEGSRYSIDFGIEVGLSKYEWHLPLTRQVNMLSEHGLEVKNHTLFDQIDTIAWYLKPTVFQGIIDAIKRSRVNIADDTTWKNLKKKSERATSKFYLWGVRSALATCFNVYEARSQAVAKDFLGDLEGFLVSDGHHSFRCLASDKLILANDWFHVRRKFCQAEKNFPEESKYFLTKIRELSKIEEELKGRPPDEILAVRKERSRPIIEELKKTADDISEITLPKSSLGIAFSYMNTLWAGLTVFLKDGEVPMHSNDIERELRSPAVGRKNHRGSHSLETAEVAAIWYSVIATCKQHEVSPREYLRATLRAILQKEPVKMPWEFAATIQDVILN
jgi:transposase